jgi:hypothetical protein
MIMMKVANNPVILCIAEMISNLSDSRDAAQKPYRNESGPSSFKLQVRDGACPRDISLPLEVESVH